MLMKIFCKFVGLTIFLFISCAVSFPASAQEGLPVDIDFAEAGFAGAGFAPTPGTGQLDSDTWIVEGLSEGGDLSFATGDFARGSSTGNVSTGGIYAFDVGGGDIALGVQPGEDDFTPGGIILKIQNNTGDTVTQLDVSYHIWHHNNEGRANSLNFSYSSDNLVYTPVSELDFTTTAAADASPVWQSVSKSAIITGFSIDDAGFFYLKWTGNDVSGSGSRDEYGIDNIHVAVSVTDIPPIISTVAPVNDATNIAVDTDIEIRFSEDVTVTASSFNINCTLSGEHTASLSGNGQDYTLAPDTDFANGETCTVTADKMQVADQDDTADNMASDYTWSFHIYAPDLFISEYVEGDGNNKGVELYNCTGATIDLNIGDYILEFYFNGVSSPGFTISLNGTVADGDVFVVANPSASFAGTADQSEAGLWYNGNDTIVLRKGGAGGTILDVIGQIGFDPGLDSEWGSGLTSTRNNTLRRNSNVSAGDINSSDVFNPATEWKGYAQDTFDGLGWHNCDCGGPATPIHDIQGDGPASPEVGKTHTIEGVVVGDFQEANQLKGFFVQEEDADADDNPATSEGIFVYYNGVNVNVGDVVRVTGKVDEYNDLTELKNVSEVIICTSGATLPSPATVSLPFADPADLEQYEGMRIQLLQTLTVTDNRDLGRYGQIVLSSGRLMNPTAITSPGAPANAQQAANDLNRIIIDDGSGIEYPDPIPYPGDGLSASNTLRGGGTVSGLTGVLHYASNKYRVHPTVTPIFVSANPRTTAPSVSGRLRIAGFNLLNYFNGDGAGGGFPTSRGADTFSEFNRQRAKIISAILAMNADVIGLTEMENEGYGTESAIQDLVNGLNDASTTGVSYAFINPGFDLGSDVIKTALLYRVETVTPVGSAATTSIGPHPPLAQTFKEISTDERFTVAVNHFKARVCGTAADGNADQGDGQGCWNLKRTQAAEALISWLGTDPTGSEDPDILIIGDLNAYAKENPIAKIEAAGYANLIADFCGTDAYSYIYSGQAGYIDHAFANDSLSSQVVGAAHWHINADEPYMLDYNEENKSAEQLASLYNNDPYRASDHDPVIVGLDLDTASPAPPNHACTDISLSGSHSIPENQPAGMFVGTLSAIDPDPGDSHTFYRVGRRDGWLDNSSFMLDRNNIRIPPFFEGDTLTAAAAFDYESKKNYTIYIRCNDSNGGSCFKSFTINVTDVNEVPAGLVLSYRWINEGEPAGTTVGMFTASGDPDIGDTHAYTLVPGEGDADNSLFSIDAGILKTGAVFDYETQKHDYSIRVRTTDSGGLTYDGQFVITLRDRNEAPTDISMSNSSVDENMPADTEIGTFSATDEDIAGSHAYSLVDGEGDADNASFRISGNYLRSKTGFDYETKHNYSIRVQTDDGSGGIFQKQFSITVTDVNDAPEDVTLSSTSVPENQPDGIAVGIFSATDADSGDSHTYSLISGPGGDDNSLFSISGNTLSAVSGFDYEARESYIVQVRTTDTRGGIYDKPFTITVEDVDEQPEIADPLADVTAYNNGESATIDMTGLFTDTDDADDAIKKMVESNTDPDVVTATINGDTLTLAFHQCGTAEITLLADSDGKTVTDTFHVTVLPVSGDMNCDGNTDMKDAVIILQVLSGINTADIYPDADTNDDGRIGTEDLIHILVNISVPFI